MCDIAKGLCKESDCGVTSPAKFELLLPPITVKLIIINLFIVLRPIRRLMKLEEKTTNHKTDRHYRLRFIYFVSDCFFFFATQKTFYKYLTTVHGFLSFAVIVYCSVLFYLFIYLFIFDLFFSFCCMRCGGKVKALDALNSDFVFSSTTQARRNSCKSVMKNNAEKVLLFLLSLEKSFSGVPCSRYHLMLFFYFLFFIFLIKGTRV